MDTIIKYLDTRKTKKGPAIIWRSVKVNEDSNPDKEITALKSKKATYKTIENGVEKTFSYNGNNYVVASKMM